MKNLCAVFLLTVATFVGSTNSSWGSAARQETLASDAIHCAAFYLIATSAFGSNPQAADHMVDLQQLFQRIYSMNEGKRIKKTITNGMVTKIKSERALEIGKAYDKDPQIIYSLEMVCDLWRQEIAEALQVQINKGVDARSAFKQVLGMVNDRPSLPASSHPRWPNSKTFVDTVLSAWTNSGRMTPYEAKQKIMRELAK